MFMNSWDTVKLYCLHNHEDPVEMILQCGGSSPFYACPHYDLTKVEKGHRRCNNRLSTFDFVKAVEHLQDMLLEAEENDEDLTLTNYAWKTKSGIEFKVLFHSGVNISLGVVNMRAIKS